MAVAAGIDVGKANLESRFRKAPFSGLRTRRRALPSFSNA